MKYANLVDAMAACGDLENRVDLLERHLQDAYSERDALKARVEELEGDVEKWRSRNDEPDFTDDDREWLASRPGKEALLAEYQRGARSSVAFMEEMNTNLDAARADLEEALALLREVRMRFGKPDVSATRTWRDWFEDRDCILSNRQPSVEGGK